MAERKPGIRDWGAILIWGFFGLAAAALLAGAVVVETYTGPVAPGSGPSPHSSSTPPGSAAGPTTGATAPCSPNGTALHETASGIAYASTCLAAPANTAFTIAFDNRDHAIAHDLHIFTDRSATTSLFMGMIVTGPAMVTYYVGPLSAGTYFFHCDVHPSQMTGTFVVG
jgi:hypothetical protein